VPAWCDDYRKGAASPLGSDFHLEASDQGEWGYRQGSWI
jgi:hypothetical protein